LPVFFLLFLSLCFQGFALRGVAFPRKFSSTKTAALLDRIDRCALVMLVIVV
jgi:hypothetical protein